MDMNPQTSALPVLSLALTKGAYLSRVVDIEAEERAQSSDVIINVLKFKGEFPRISAYELNELIKDKTNVEAIYAVARKYPERFSLWDLPTEDHKKTTQEQFGNAWHFEENPETGEKIPLNNDLLDMLLGFNFISNAIAMHMSLAINELDVKTTIGRMKKGN